jgi:hypothetical protein
MPFILGANSVSGYTVKNSLRFNDDSSDYLNRTPASASNRKTYTISTWIKRSNISSDMGVLEAATDSSNRTYLSISTFNTNELSFVYRTGGTNTAVVSSSNLLRDVSAWYHIVCAVDTTQATANNRIRLYINGSEVSYATQTMPSQNTDMYINNNIAHHISRAVHASERYFDGYLSEFNFIDGQQLTPSSFGETDTLTGIWIPKAYTGSYGTNGFNLQFKNSASLGTDSSGNGNTFTVNNLTSVDQSTDTPTNNFATMNPLGNYYPASTFSEGNLRMVTVNANPSWSFNLGTIGVSTGKWYWETKSISGSSIMLGISSLFSTSASDQLGESTNQYSYNDGGNIRNNGITLASYSSYTTNDIIGIALDATNSKLYVSKNGTFQNSADPSAGTGGISISQTSSGTGFWFPAGGDGNTPSITLDFNFGNPPYSANSYTDGAGYGNFSYAVPSGYYSLNTKNLANFG